MNKRELVQKLQSFKDKAFCHYTHQRANQIWKEVRKHIPSPYGNRICIEWGHVKLGHGFKQACAALDDEIKECIKYLENDGNVERR